MRSVNSPTFATFGVNYSCFPLGFPCHCSKIPPTNKWSANRYIYSLEITKRSQKNILLVLQWRTAHARRIFSQKLFFLLFFNYNLPSVVEIPCRIIVIDSQEAVSCYRTFSSFFLYRPYIRTNFKLYNRQPFILWHLIWEWYVLLGIYW